MASRNGSHHHSEEHKLTVGEKFCNLKKHFAPLPASAPAPVPAPEILNPPHVQHVYYEEKDVLFVPEETINEP